MSMPNLARRWTREEVLALPDDGNRYELLDGDLLVSPSPGVPHQRAVWALFDRIRPFVKQHRLGEAGFAPCDLDLRSGQLLQPDVFVFGFAQEQRPRRWSEFDIPLLVVEVLSPSTALYDRNRKRVRYLEAGVREDWIVDTDARLIERWSGDESRPEILTDRIVWRPDPPLPSLEIDLAEYFREGWGEPAASML